MTPEKESKIDENITGIGSVLHKLLVRNFRNYTEAEVEFVPGVNLLVGENAQGKTNLLEAIYLLAMGRSFRTHRLSELIRLGSSFFYIEGHFERDGVSQTITVYADEKERCVHHNQTLLPSPTHVLGILPMVLLSPEDHSLISGAPAGRRRLLDIHISQMDPHYILQLARYFRGLKQRNHILKTTETTSLRSWEKSMATAAHYLIEKREQHLATLGPMLSKWADTLSGGDDELVARYIPSPTIAEGIGIDTFLQQHWEETRAKEMLYGITLTGPHRDDFSLTLSHKSARTFSSEGQKRSAATALRLAEYDLIQQTLHTPPLLGIDDFGIQLDARRQKTLEGHLLHFHQSFLTSPKSLLSVPHREIYIRNGIIESAPNRQPLEQKL